MAGSETSTAACVGDPESVQQQGDAAEHTGSKLQQLMQLLDTDVCKLVPQRWDGRAATGFQRYWQKLLDLTGQTSGLAEAWATSLQTNAAILREAKALLADAQAFVAEHGLSIGDDLVVVSHNAVDPNDPV